MSREKQIDIIIDLLTDFDEMGFIPSTAVPNHEAYAIKWRAEITKALENYFKQSEWISVDERLPETDEQVLVYGMRGSIRVCRYEARYDIHFKGIKTAFYKNDDKKAMNVRYWMPLPEAPKMKGGAE